MRIPEVVIETLCADPSLNFAQRALYLFASANQPENTSELARLVGISRSTCIRYCRHLCLHGWMELSVSPRELRPLPLIPHACQKRMAESLMELYRLVPYKGEFLMKCNLDLWIASDDFVDNARPDYLVNPKTGKPLEFDRLYRAGVAFEYNGAQHATTTSEYPNREDLNELRTRDLVKWALTNRAGIQLVVFTTEDLRHEVFEKFLPECLPRKHVDRNGPYCRTLARMCESYIATATRGSISGPDRA